MTTAPAPHRVGRRGRPGQRDAAAAGRRAGRTIPVHALARRGMGAAGRGLRRRLDGRSYPRGVAACFRGTCRGGLSTRHTGWRKIGEDWIYLHAGGAIGKHGPAAAIAVSLPDALAGFQLPDPPDGPALAEAIRASLRMLDGLAPDRIAFPLLAVAYRAVLGPADFSEHLAGPTGNYKTELGTLAQQHYGAEINARNLPGSWGSHGQLFGGRRVHPQGRTTAY